MYPRSKMGKFGHFRLNSAKKLIKIFHNPSSPVC